MSEHSEDAVNYSVLQAEYSHLAVIVDLQCTESFGILAEVCCCWYVWKLYCLIRSNNEV